jgi:hypothetical protein
MSTHAARTMQSLGAMGDWYRTEHPFAWARDEFLAGNIPMSQAVAMVARDRDFIAETEMGDAGESPLEAATRVVWHVWRPELVARIQAEKREERERDEEQGRAYLAETSNLRG